MLNFWKFKTFEINESIFELTRGRILNTSKYLSVSVKSMLDMSLYVNPKKWVMLQNKNLVGPKKGF